MSLAIVHPTALVGAGAQLGQGVKIGPYCIVGDRVVLHDNVELVSHVSIDGNTVVGAGTRIYPFASVGHEPQDLKYHGEASRLEIGERCVIRESVTINPGTEGGGMLTKIGNECLIMASAHVAHDAIIGNNVIMANYVGIAGHCQMSFLAALASSISSRALVRTPLSARNRWLMATSFPTAWLWVIVHR